MPSTSSIVDKSLREHVSPVLRDAGFQRVEARHAWSWRDSCVWVYRVRSVGSYFSQVTGWPPGSFAASLNVCFPFMPQYPVKLDPQGRPLPVASHMRLVLPCGLDQSSLTCDLRNPAERVRTDLWWIDPDGARATEAAIDVANALIAQGLHWLELASNLRTAFAMVESEHDSFVKYAKLHFLASEFGDDALMREWGARAETEALRLGKSTDRDTWLMGDYSL